MNVYNSNLAEAEQRVTAARKTRADAIALWTDKKAELRQSIDALAGAKKRKAPGYCFNADICAPTRVKLAEEAVDEAATAMKKAKAEYATACRVRRHWRRMTAAARRRETLARHPRRPPTDAEKKARRNQIAARQRRMIRHRLAEHNGADDAPCCAQQ